MEIQLIQINALGRPVKDAGRLDDLATQICGATARLYQNAGFAPPWVGYLAMQNGQLVGACAFKSAPAGGRVEIGYITFPDFEGRGIATAMVRRLLEIARCEQPELNVIAQTDNEENASNAILRKCGFRFAGAIDDAENGTLWEWQLPACEQAYSHHV